MFIINYVWFTEYYESTLLYCCNGSKTQKQQGKKTLANTAGNWKKKLYNIYAKISNKRLFI